MANGKRDIRVYVFLKKISTKKSAKIILTFDAKANLLNFTAKLKTASSSGKCMINMVTWSFLPLVVCRKRHSKCL